MKLLLCAGNGGRRMGPEAMNFLDFHGFDGVRLAIFNGQPESSIRESLEELAEHNLSAILIVGGWDWWNGGDTVSARDEAPTVNMMAVNLFDTVKVAQDIGLDFRIEIGNEPNLAPSKYKNNPRHFTDIIRALTLDIATAERFDEVQFVSGGVSNVNLTDGLAYLRAVVGAGLPSHVELGLHTYRSTPIDQSRGLSLGLIAGEVRSLHPQFAVTEGGWHTATRKVKRGFPLCFTKKRVPGLSDKDVATFATWELDFWSNQGAETYAWYQLNSGSDENNPEDNFGIRNLDGTAKPVARALKEWKERNR